jgi:hypothetical protein
MPRGDSFRHVEISCTQGGNPKKFTLQRRIIAKFFARGNTKHTHFAGGKCLFKSVYYVIRVRLFKSGKLLPT